MHDEKLEEGFFDWLGKEKKQKSSDPEGEPEEDFPEPGPRMPSPATRFMKAANNVWWKDMGYDFAKERILKMAVVSNRWDQIKEDAENWPPAAFIVYQDLAKDLEVRKYIYDFKDNRGAPVIANWIATAQELEDEFLDYESVRMREHLDTWERFSNNSPETETSDDPSALKEYFYSFMPMVNFTDKTINDIRPPASSVEEVLMTWAMDDIKLYDDMLQTEGAAYHVLLPTKEVCQVMGVDVELRYPGSNAERVTRRRAIVEDGEVKNPVVIAVGKNGKASIIWGDKQLIAAYDAGLKDIPIVFEYHSRV
jgi:hypothetical protein